MVPRFVHFRTTDEIGVRRSNYYPKDRVIYGLPTYPTHLLTYYLSTYLSLLIGDIPFYPKLPLVYLPIYSWAI